MAAETRSLETMILRDSRVGFEVLVKLGRPTEDELEGCLARVTIEGPTLATRDDARDLRPAAAVRAGARGRAVSNEDPIVHVQIHGTGASVRCPFCRMRFRVHPPPPTHLDVRTQDSRFLEYFCDLRGLIFVAQLPHPDAERMAYALHDLGRELRQVARLAARRIHRFARRLAAAARRSGR